MTVNESNATRTNQKISGRQLIIAIMLSILTYWLFAQAFLNIGPNVQKTYPVSPNIINISISLTSFVTGVFMVVGGNISDRVGKVKMTRVALILSIIGSIAIIITGNAVLLLLGRALQGLSAAIIMPTTIAMINDYFEGEERQKALSYWSIGSFGGTGLASFFAGAIATFTSWQMIFVMSIIGAIIALFLIKSLPEQHKEKQQNTPFDYVGLVIFVLMIGSISFVITQGNKIGWSNIITIILAATFVISIVIFIAVEKRKAIPFMDLTLFKNRSYVGAVVSNCLLNTGVGVIALINIYAQAGHGLSGFSAGLITLPYLIALLLVVRLGEKSIKKFGAKRAMVFGPICTGFGVLLMSITFIDSPFYIILTLIATIFFGAGTGFFATPALSTAVSTTASEKIGVASGIFKMGSTLGGAFGIAIITSIYTGLSVAGYSVHLAASVSFIVGTCLIGSAIVVSTLVLPNTGREHNKNSSYTTNEEPVK